MTSLESTEEYPLMFIITFLRSNGDYLYKKFETYSDIADEECFFNAQKYTLTVYRYLPWDDTRGHTRDEIVDEESNLYEIEMTFDEFVKEQFAKELKNSKSLISARSRKNGYDQDRKLYSQILLDCLSLQKQADSLLELNFRNELDGFISSILTFVYKKFNRFYPRIPEIKRVKAYYLKRNESNITGFKIKSQDRKATIHDFLENLKQSEYISSRTKEESVQQFLAGIIPKYKINWIKDLHELHYFIETLVDDSILHEAPRQKWKFMSEIFQFKGEELPINWHRNNNKLKDKKKIRAINRIVDMLRPVASN